MPRLDVPAAAWAECCWWELRVCPRTSQPPSSPWLLTSPAAPNPSTAFPSCTDLVPHGHCVPQLCFSAVPTAPPCFTQLFAGVGGFQREKAPGWEGVGMPPGGIQGGTLIWTPTPSDPTAAQCRSHSPACGGSVRCELGSPTGIAVTARQGGQMRKGPRRWSLAAAGASL